MRFLFDAQLQKDSVLDVLWEAPGMFDYVELGEDHAPYLVSLGNFDHDIRIIDGTTGQELWSYRAQGDNELKYTWAGDLFILGENEQTESKQSWLRAYQFPAMRQLWETGGEIEQVSRLAGDADWLIAGEIQEEPRSDWIYRLDLTDGHRLWRAQLGICDHLLRYGFDRPSATIQVECGDRLLTYGLESGKVQSIHTIKAEVLYNLIDAGGGRHYQIRHVTKNESGKGQAVLYCYLDAVDVSKPYMPSRLWSQPISADMWNVALYAGDVIYRDRNLVTRLHRDTGAVVWQTEVSGFVSQGVKVMGRRIFGGSPVGFVSMLDADTGELTWEQDIWGSIEPRYIKVAPLAITADGLLVAGRGDDFRWVVLKLGLDASETLPTPVPVLETPTRIIDTPTPVFTPPAPNELSKPPQHLEDWAAAMLSFLNANPNNHLALERLLKSWADAFINAIKSNLSGFNTQGEIEIEPADLTGDGSDELIVVFNAHSSFVAPGLVVVLQPDANGTYRAIYNEIAYLPKLEAVVDLDRDARNEMVYSTNYENATAAELTVIPLDWDGQALVDISEDPIYTTNADLVQVRDTTGDAQVEIIIHGGTNGSLAAGPVRDYTYSLVDGRYRLFSQEPDDADSYYFLVTDAHNAFMAGDLYEAIRMFTYALTSPEAQALIDDWGFHDEEAKHAYADPMKAFAEYQLMLAYIQKGDEDKAAEWALTGHYPDMLYSQVKTVFWNTYQQTHDWTQAAEAARTQARLAGYDAIQLLRDLGYANEGLDLEDVCPCPQCRQGSIE